MTVQLHNQQYSCFLHQANKLRQLGAFCDTVIVVESQTFRAHSLLLACASKKLENVLSSRQHGQQYHCTLDLLSSRTFQQILDYVYTETLEVSTEDLHGLFKAAQLLEMHQLGEQCRAQLETLNSAPDACQEEAGAAQQAPLDMLQGSPSREEQSDLEVIERSSSPPHHLKNPRPDSTLLVAVPPRVSVIASTAQGALKPTPSRSPRLGWHPIPSSPRMALTSTDFMALRTLHPSEHLVACPFPVPTPVYPLFSPSGLPQSHHSSIMGYAGILHPFHHALIPGSRELDVSVKHNLQRKSGLMDAALMGSMPEEEKRKLQERIDKRFHCRPHGKEFLDSHRLQMHAGVASGPGEVPLGCKHCGRYFRDESALRSHRRVHSGEKPYQCERCPKRFSLKHQLDTHHRVHTASRSKLSH
ncbi:zinc finger and BTB domain-containing protein 16 isoform X2 [Scleropages formosus]|uniref:zinc finger and BTB domain-containing protein 16 isoform X2 n=1 Tax=Scleropages formosus TaxID=113540 RepID=UPI00087806A8|nr:zinc finger and BTB domain-containing protein 32 isoform X2 [Scleropages formosus]